MAETEGNMIKNKVLENVERVIVGKSDIAQLLLTALLAEGHVLLEDVPGTGKTKIAKTLAASIDAGFSRIQFTPDLLPSDVTGLNIYDRAKNEFVLRKGPVFTNVLLADEINRATPRTQAGLLECMEEKQVTIDGETYALENPFFVIATQNPVETAGTFPLPEAQMDRFMMKLSMGLPTKEQEIEILNKYMIKDPLEETGAVLTKEELYQIKEEIKQVYVHNAVKEYMVDIIEKTRIQGKVMMGVSPRGTLAFLRCVKTYAYLQGRDYVIPDDIKALAVPVLAHRIILSYGYQKTEENQKFIKDILEQVKVPTEEFSRE